MLKLHLKTKTFFAPGCKHIYFCYKVGHFNMEVYGDLLTLGASLKWPKEELLFLAIVGWLHFSIPRNVFKTHYYEVILNPEAGPLVWLADHSFRAWYTTVSAPFVLTTFVRKSVKNDETKQTLVRAFNGYIICMHLYYLYIVISY